MPAGDPNVDPLASPSPRIRASHLRGNATLIEVNQVLGRNLADLPEELFALPTVGFAVALGGVE